jgi:adenine specific DNA methylase mod
MTLFWSNEFRELIKDFQLDRVGILELIDHDQSEIVAHIFLKQDMDYHKEIEYIHIFQKSNKVSPNKPVKPYDYQAFNRYFIEGEISKTIQLGGKTVEVLRKVNGK